MNNSYRVYSQINALPEFGFIAGTTYTLYFNVYEENGVNPLDMGGATFRWVLTRYGLSESVLEVEGSITGIGTAEVQLTTNDTKNLSGKFIHQPVIISFTGEEYRPSQGTLIIAPRVPLI
jgi:hypothetical protein